jgi:hypothetical protein
MYNAYAYTVHVYNYYVLYDMYNCTCTLYDYIYMYIYYDIGLLPILLTCRGLLCDDILPMYMYKHVGYIYILIIITLYNVYITVF